MARFGIGFNKAGKFTTFPTVFSSVNADNLDMRNQGPTGTMAILGVGAGFFPPQVASALPFQLGSPQRFITASDLLTAAEFAIKPFPEIDRAVGQIFVVPVNISTQSQTILKESAVDKLTLDSKGWGLKFNTITVKHTAGDYIAKFNALLGDLDTDTVLTDTDYAATNPAVNLADYYLDFNLTLAKINADASLPGSAADYVALFTATDNDDAFLNFPELLRQLDVDLAAGGNTYAVSHGDAVPNKIEIKLPTATSTVVENYSFITVTRAAADINERSALVDATLNAEATAAIDDHTTATAMTGGTEPAATNQNWADALEALNGIRINTIHVVSSDATVWAALSAYCTLHRCRGFVGSGLHLWNGVANRQASIGTLKAEAGGLNAPRMVHVGLGMDGKAAYLSTAARYAALSAAVEPSVPITYKHLDAVSLEAALDISTEVGGVDGLLLSGVSVPVPDPQNQNTFLVSRGLSTWTGDDNLYRREQSVLAAVDAIQDNVEAAMGQFLGKEGTARTVERALRVMFSVLTKATDLNAAVRINSFRPESLQASFTSDTVLRVSAAITPIPPINFVDVILNLERTEITIEFDVNLAA